MRNRRFLAMAVMAFVVGGWVALAKSAVPVAAAKSALAVSIVVDKDTYTLDPSQAGKAFRDKLEAMKIAHDALPLPPAVELTLKVTNTSDKDVTVTLDGDGTHVDLKVVGIGAVMMQNNVAMTMEMRMGKPVVIGPGKSQEIKIKSLASGVRGVTQMAYWTEPGEYAITAVLAYSDKGKETKVESEAVKVKVVGKV